MEHLRKEVESASKLVAIFEEEARANKRKIAKLESMVKSGKKGAKTSLTLSSADLDDAMDSAANLTNSALSFEGSASSLAKKYSAKTPQQKPKKTRKRKVEAVSATSTKPANKKVKESSTEGSADKEQKKPSNIPSTSVTPSDAAKVAVVVDEVQEEDDDFDAVINASSRSLHVSSPSLVPEVASRTPLEKSKSLKTPGSRRLFNSQRPVEMDAANDKQKLVAAPVNRQPLRSLTTFNSKKGGAGADLFAQYLRGGNRSLKIPKLKPATKN